MEATLLHLNPQDSLAQLEHVFARLKSHFVNRDAVLEQILYALLTKEHALIIGDRGLAKSHLARSVFNQFQSPRPTFSLQLTRSTSVGQLVGGLDLSQFEKGVYVHTLDGYIVKAQFAFLDELFDANDFVLRALNGILNEREFLNGPQIEKAALHTAIATTNYIRDTRESRAVLDRLLFKCIVHRAEGTLERFAIRKGFLSHHGNAVPSEAKGAMSYEALNSLSQIVTGDVPSLAISIPPHILVMLDQIITDFERTINERRTEDRFVFSDRSKNKAIHVVMASAMRGGRSVAEVRDLAALHYCIPTVGSSDEEEVFDHWFNQALKGFSPRDRESIDDAARIFEIVSEAISRHADGTLNEPNWSEKISRRVKHWMRRDSDLTLQSLLDQTREMGAEHPVTQKMREELLHAIREAHEIHHIAFEQKL